MKLQLSLPIIDEYSVFVNDNKKMKNIEGVYKIQFIDGYYYIGNTANYISRVYNHCTVSDLNKTSKKTLKHERMLKAIKNNEVVIFDLISFNMNDERQIIDKHIDDAYCLNMKR